MKFRIVKKEKKQQSDQRFVENTKKKRRRRGKRRVMTPFYVVLLLFIIAGAVYLCLTMLFNVDRFNIVGNTLYSERELIETTGIEKGDNLFQIDTDYAEDKLYSVYSYIESAEVKRSFPNAVTITITEAVPFAALEEADGYTLLSTGGKVLERGLEEVPRGMAAVRGISTITSTEDDQKRLELLKRIMTEMHSLNMEGYDFIDLTDTLEITMICDSRIRVELGNELELEYKLQFVNEIVENKIEPTGFFLVDASVPGEVMTKAMTVSPWDTLEKVTGSGFADEDEE
ncbi:MAG: cell division protein FtsQ/DivIB [Oscillospiraceae bacterium]